MELRIESVAKRYRGGTVALEDFSLTLRPGIVGLLGPNGAGKSSLMRILATIARPSSGAVFWNGVDIGRKPDEIRNVLGYLPQDFGVYPNLTAIEFLTYLAAAKGLDPRRTRARIDELIDAVNLRAAASRPIGRFSGGMRQRVGIAQALLNDPAVLIVDEPTVSLDPGERVRFRSMISELPGDRIVILSTHIVPDVETTATTIALIDKGRLVESGTSESLLASVDGTVWRVVVPSDEIESFRHRFLVTDTVRRPDGVAIRVISESSPAPGAERLVPTLEDAYMLRVSSFTGSTM